MEVFLKLLPDKTTTFCANWITGPALPVGDGDSLRGLMSDMFRLAPEDPHSIQYRTLLSYSKLPDGFLTHELVALAKGSEEKIARITSEYGLLVSPLLYTTHRECFTNVLSQATHYPFSSAPARHVRMLFQLNELKLGYPDFFYSTRKIISKLSLSELCGMVASFDEIRATAKSLLDAADVVAKMASGKSAVEIIGDSGTGLDNLDFLSDCLRDIGRAPKYVVVDSKGRKLDISELSDEELKRLPEGVGDAIKKASFNRHNVGTLTEAVATMIKNIAESGRTWDYCAHCGQMFPLSPGQLRKVKREFKRYCSQRCKSSAATKKYRLAKTITHRADEGRQLI